MVPVPRLLTAALLAAALVVVGTPGPAAAERKCRVEVGELIQGVNPLNVGSCRWADVPPEAVVDILSEPETWHLTFRTVVAGELLRDGRLLQVLRVKPFGKRQVTIEFTTTNVAGIWRVAWHKAAAQEPLEEGLMEVEFFEGWWEVKSDGNGGSVVVHAARLDPGEDIPRVVVRKGHPMQIRQLLRQLRRAIVRDEDRAGDSDEAPDEEPTDQAAAEAVEGSSDGPVLEHASP